MHAGPGAGTTQLPPPAYDRTGLSVGIVHFGVGGFHRAHQAAYVDSLMQQGLARDWAICGVGVLTQDRFMGEVMAAQDCLYTLVVKEADGTLDARVVGSIVDYLFAPDDPDAVLDRLTDPRTRIVSLTITEGGYLVDEATGTFDAGAPGIVADLRPGAVPTTVFGFVTEALDRRRRAGVPAFAVMSCDNVPGNGEIAQRVFTAFATLKDPALGQWVAEHVGFPSSMVDRITPSTTDADRALVRERLGIDDRWPVVCERYSQWVLEDRFGDGRPPFEAAGVQLVDDVEPYELMKLRLLNAGHQAISYLGFLSGCRYVHEVVADPLFETFLRGYLDEEAAPTLAPVPGVDLARYQDLVVERFGNPEIRDSLTRVCAYSSDRIPRWVVPVVRHALAHDGELRRAALVVASWARFAEGVDESGRPIEVVDRRGADLTERARRHSDDPLAFVRNAELFGDLADRPRFATAYVSALESLRTRGARATLEEWERG